jgi:hypothetical protein
VCWYHTVEHISTVVVLQDLLVGDRGNTIVIELEPSSVFLGFDQGEVVSTVEITRVDQDTMLVHVRHGLISLLVEVLGEVD